MTRLIGIGITAGLLSGCAAVNPRPAFVDVEKTVAARTGLRTQWVRSAAEAEQVEATVRELLQGEMIVEAAVQVALLNNPSLQATYEEVGISYADLVQAGLIRNPLFTASARFTQHLPGANTELFLAQDFFDILIRPLRKKIAAVQLEQTKLRVAHEVLNLAAEVKTAYFTLQARQQLVKRLRLILDITQTAADFAGRQHEAGTISELDLVNQQAFYNQSRVDLAIAQVQVRQDRERLNRLLGLWGPRTDWKIADELPSIPEREISVERLESLAMERRNDIEAARWGVNLIGRALALRKKTRFFPIGVEIGIDSERDILGERVTGPNLALQLPIFDTGKASIARLEAEHLQAQRQLEALAVNARSQVRETRDLMLATRDLAQYYGTVLLPQRVQILELTLQHYNMMFRGAYDLLLAKQSEVATERAYVDALRDYWIARAELERALGGGLPAERSEEALKP